MKKTDIIYEQFIKPNRDKMHKYNDNLIIVFTGATGKGKSLGAVELSRILMLPMKFNVNFSVCRSIEELLEKVSTNPPKGTIFVLDEGSAEGAGAAARAHGTKQNRGFGSVLQTFRGKNYGLIACSPNFGFLDKQLRSLVDYIFIPQFLDRKRNVNYFAVYSVETNALLGKVYKKRLVLEGEDGLPRTIKLVGINRPPKPIEDAYVQVKNKFMDDYILEQLENIRTEKIKNKPKVKKTTQEYVDEMLPKLNSFLKSDGKQIDRNLVRAYDESMPYHKSGEVSALLQKNIDTRKSKSQKTGA